MEIIKKSVKIQPGSILEKIEGALVTHQLLYGKRPYSLILNCKDYLSLSFKIETHDISLCEKIMGFKIALKVKGEIEYGIDPQDAGYYALGTVEIENHQT